MIHCPVCHEEVGCDTDMLLVPPKRQVPRHDLYINDCVLLLDISLNAAIGPKNTEQRFMRGVSIFCEKVW